MSFSGRDASAKQFIHLLQWNTLRLGYEEEDKDERAKHERGEEEVDAIVHSVEHLGRETGDDEVL